MGGGKLTLGMDPEVLADLVAGHFDRGGAREFDCRGVGGVDGLALVGGRAGRGRSGHRIIVAPPRPVIALPGQQPVQWGRMEP